MGVPSISIYINELMQEYDVQKLIRVGTCGAIQKDVKVRDVILAQSATTNSPMNRDHSSMVSTMHQQQILIYC